MIRPIEHLREHSQDDGGRLSVSPTRTRGLEVERADLIDVHATPRKMDLPEVLVSTRSKSCGRRCAVPVPDGPRVLKRKLVALV